MDTHLHWMDKIRRTQLSLITALEVSVVAVAYLFVCDLFAGNLGLWAGIGFVLASVLTGGSGLAIPTIMRLRGAAPVSYRQMPRLATVLRELAARADLPRVPGLYYSPSPELNAFTVGSPARSGIALSHGTLTYCSERETVAILAHEISHIRNNDHGLMSAAQAMHTLTQTLAFAAMVGGLVVAPLVLFGAEVGGILRLAMLCLASSVVSGLAFLAMSRTREYAADLDAVELTHDAEGLASALNKIHRAERSLVARLLGLTAVDIPQHLRTHPPVTERIRRLREYALAER
jgi:heat shock protein HtpX